MTTTTQAARLDLPLMKNNIHRDDLDAVCALLRQDDPVLTQSRQVRAFEEEWSRWLGVRHSVFVSSGSSANLLTLAALRALHGPGGEVIVPTITPGPLAVSVGAGWPAGVVAVLVDGSLPPPHPAAAHVTIKAQRSRLNIRT